MMYEPQSTINLSHIVVFIAGIAGLFIASFPEMIGLFVIAAAIASGVIYLFMHFFGPILNAVGACGLFGSTFLFAISLGQILYLRDKRRSSLNSENAVRDTKVYLGMP